MSILTSPLQPPSTLQIATGGLYLQTTVLDTVPSLPGASGSYAWRVTQPAGTGMSFQLTDAGGAVGYVQNVYIKNGDSSCLSGAAASGSSSAASGVSGMHASRGMRAF